ncbi:MAG: TraR/DksA family transcriptional regulator [Candidatus Dormibacterales bacterium]
MSRGFRDADSTQLMSEQATSGEIDRILEKDREQAAHAEIRKSEGAYGRCEDCGKDIGAERLVALPAATRCVRCQAAWEQTTR